ncbi:hypothetical protein BCR33DRAFT_459564 [Rhizoclosmatium globosum]|uniref:Uncharacterized protein n=1 Tax=Rhizoclosmatium globosum TaxID=329046 RepID=A0A1Y2CZ22_9FUNG|nr:hypothetical protein BCR33DRAFT_459564 [Rhizoclosmatium globosum]|eukprot:ORY51595.1 hypothetical protein BCR33DRAFT_459564 [Rhizoclosmatium globosum]
MRSSRTLPLAATSNLALPIRKQASYIPPVPSAELHRPNRELLKTVSISSMTESTTSIIDAKSSTSVSKRSSVTTPPSKIKKPSESFFLLSSKPITDEDVIQYNLLNKRASESVRNNKSTKSNSFQNLKSSKLDFFDTDSIGESITSYDRQSTGSKGVAMKRSTGSSNGVSDDWMRNMAQMSSRIKSKR